MQWMLVQSVPIPDPKIISFHRHGHRNLHVFGVVSREIDSVRAWRKLVSSRSRLHLHRYFCYDCFSNRIHIYILIVNSRSNLFLIHIHYTSEADFLLAASLLSPSPFLSPLFLGLFPSTGIIMMCRQQNRWMLYCPKKKIHLLISPLKADL